MVNDRKVKIACVLHRSAHDAGVGYRAAVIRNGNSARCLHLAHFCEFRSVGRLSDRADRENICERRPFGLFERRRTGEIAISRGRGET